MRDIFAAIARAFGNLFDSRIISLVFLPMLGSILLWTVLAWTFWGSWTGTIAGAMKSTTVAGWLQGWGATWIVDYTAALLVLIGIMPAVYVSALVITEIVVMPAIMKLVGERYFPDLKRERGGTLAGSLRNAAAGIGIFAVLWIITLPLWLTGVGAVLAPVLISAYLNQRIFRYDALAEHASRDEIARITRTSRGDLFLLGILLSLLLYVPVANLLMPAISALAFTHFGLGLLAKERKK